MKKQLRGNAEHIYLKAQEPDEPKTYAEQHLNTCQTGASAAIVAHLGWGARMPSLTMNLVKRVDRLPKPSRTSEALQPLFEAISNSIQSTQAKFGNKVHKYARIVVTVETGRKQQPVRVLVEDNGVGLDKNNYEAFITTDTDNKIAIGGKGVGRLLWLDCFEFDTCRKQLQRWEGYASPFIRFSVIGRQSNPELRRQKAAAFVKETGAAIAFTGLRSNGYREKFPGRATYVFQHLTSHFLPIFIASARRKITVHCGDETRHYPEAINAIIHRRQDLDIPKADDYGDPLPDPDGMRQDCQRGPGRLSFHSFHCARPHCSLTENRRTIGPQVLRSQR